MKKYTLTIIYDDRTGELESLTEKIDEEQNNPLSITASAYVMEQIDNAHLIEELCVPFPGECIGES
tara:strand:- start:184 stop:381 length:198 start_codon:yes stop_codon:yes gene_type:complete